MTYQNIFPQLYTIYEEEGEDEDWLECYPDLLASTDSEKSEVSIEENSSERKLCDHNASESTRSGTCEKDDNSGLSSLQNSESYCYQSDFNVASSLFDAGVLERQNFDFKQEKLNELAANKNKSSAQKSRSLNKTRAN